MCRGFTLELKCFSVALVPFFPPSSQKVWFPPFGGLDPLVGSRGGFLTFFPHVVTYDSLFRASSEASSFSLTYAAVNANSNSSRSDAKISDRPQLQLLNPRVQPRGVDFSRRLASFGFSETLRRFRDDFLIFDCLKRPRDHRPLLFKRLITTQTPFF